MWYLRRNRLFERLSDDRIAFYEHLFTPKTYPKGTLLFERHPALHLGKQTTDAARSSRVGLLRQRIE